MMSAVIWWTTTTFVTIYQILLFCLNLGHIPDISENYQIFQLSSPAHYHKCLSYFYPWYNFKLNDQKTGFLPTDCTSIRKKDSLNVGVSLIPTIDKVKSIGALLYCRVPKYARTTLVLRYFDWLPVRERFRFKVLLLFLRTINCRGPVNVQTAVPVCVTYCLLHYARFIARQPSMALWKHHMLCNV